MAPTPTVHLGYELGTGTPVEIPLKHLAICGQTQEAGKTTALEALISRAHLPAITFVTKRGEGSFQQARRIDPYFREQADWQFVASILEASRGEKLKFERAWIIRASKGARTLADVQRNVRQALEKAKGLSADVYLTLDAYLEAVVPQIARITWAPGLQLQPGVNVMDLAGFTVEMQHLVIKSSLEWVLAKAEGTVVVIPEAWKFIPEGRGTPVKLAAEAFIRQAAGMRNYVWLDSQDLGGIAKVILRSVPLWILGVQREANEIKRTLANIPTSIAKPTASAVATLELGQFYACWGKHVVRTYVQPAWMAARTAERIAVGEATVADALQARQLMPQFDADEEEDQVDVADAQALRDENARLRRENEDLRRRLERVEGTLAAQSRSQQKRLQVQRGATPDPPREEAAVPPRTCTPEETFDTERLYQAFKTRLIEELPTDSRVMAIVLAQPELRVRVQRPVLEVSGESLRGRIGRLLADGFFEREAQTTSTVLSELSRRGFSTAPPNVSKELGELARLGFLTRENKWWRGVPAMKVHIVEASAEDRGT